MREGMETLRTSRRRLFKISDSTAQILEKFEGVSDGEVIDRAVHYYSGMLDLLIPCNRCLFADFRPHTTVRDCLSYLEWEIQSIEKGQSLLMDSDSLLKVFKQRKNDLLLENP